MKVTVVETQSHLPPHQQVHGGLRWQDMPGTGSEIKKLNFFLFRRGLYDPRLEAVSDEDSGLTEEELLEARRDVSGRVLKRLPGGAGDTFGSVRGLASRRGKVRTVPEIEDRVKRQARFDVLAERFTLGRKTRGFMEALRAQDETAWSSFRRAMGRGRATQGLPRWVTIKRTEQAFDALKEKGWTV
jgi:hypothetical protein